MARKSSGLSVFLATLALLALLPVRNAHAQDTSTTVTTVSGLNTITNGQTQWVTVTFNSDVLATIGNRYIITDIDAMVAPGAGVAVPYSNLDVNKRGAGVWRLNNGANTLTAPTSNQFNINAGTLELMNGTTLTLTGGATSTRFTVGGGTTLNARGANTITSPLFTVGSGATFGFDLIGLSGSTPVLTLAGNVDAPNPSSVNLNLLGFQTQARTDASLLQYSYTRAAVQTGIPEPPIRAVDDKTNPSAFTANIGQGLRVRGELWSDVVLAHGNTQRLSGTLDQDYPTANTGGTSTIKITGLISSVGEVRWTGATSGNWNATEANWTGSVRNSAGATLNVSRFLHGDTVTFSDSSGANVDITIQSGGVQIGSFFNQDYSDQYDVDSEYGMLIDSGIFTFANQSGNIGIDGAGSIWIMSNDTNAATTEVTFGSANSYWGGTYIGTNAQLTLKHLAGVGSGTVNIKTGGKLILDSPATNPTIDVFYNEINGDGEIEKIGNNTVRIDGVVSGKNDTTINEGVLQNNIGSGVLTVNQGATYKSAPAAFNAAKDSFTGTSRAVAGIKDGTAGGGNIEMGTRPVDPANPQNIIPLTLSITTASGTSYSFSGTISGNGADVIKSGPGTQIFASDNEYDGGTTVQQGILSGQRSLDALTGSITITPFGPGAVQVDEGAILQLDIMEPSSFGDPQYVASLANTITGEGTVQKTGDGILALTATDSTYTGLTDVYEGYLRITNVKSTGETNEVRLYGDRGSVAESVLQFGTGVSSTIGSADAPYDRAIKGDGNVEVLDNTTVYLSGFNVYTPSDPLELEELRESSYTGTTTVFENANLILTDTRGTGLTSEVNLTTVTSNLIFDFASQKDDDGKEVEQTYNRYITGLGNLTKRGAGTVVLDYDPATGIPNDYEGTTLVQNGTLKLMYAEATGGPDAVPDQSVIVQRDGILELAFEGIYQKGITGAGAIAKSEAGTTTTLKGYSDYTGGTYIYSGTLSFTDITSQEGNLGVGGIFFQRGGGTLQNTGVVPDLEQSVVIDGGSTATFDTQADLTIGPDWGVVHRTLADDDPYVNPDDPRSHLVKIGPADMTIDGAAGWTGTTTVKEGWLNNNIPVDTALTVHSGAGYFTGNSDRQVSAIYGESDTTGGEIRTVAGHDFIVNYKNTDTPDTFAGGITGGGNLVLIGNGKLESGVPQYTTLILTGDNTYAGSTTVTGSFGALVGNIAQGTDLTVDTGNFYYAGGDNRLIGSLQGGGTVDMQSYSLTIRQNDMSFTPDFSGSIKNGRSLSKQGGGSQALTGLSYQFSEDVKVEQGTLILGSTLSSQTTLDVGRNLYVSEPATLAVGAHTKINVKEQLNIQGTLDMVVGNSLITAGSVTLGKNSVLNVSGITESDVYTTIIKSSTVITDDFGAVTVAGDQPTVDYLTLDVAKSEDQKEIQVGQLLSWYASYPNAHGNFTLNDPDGSYTVARELRDVTGTFKPGVWDGKSLTKKGPGKLVLAVANTYTGPTDVQDGTLKLTHEKATGGSSGVKLSASGTLELDFDSRDSKGVWTEGMKTPISGQGQVVKTGYSSIAVLSGKNTYTGDTYVRQGGLLVDGSSLSRVWVEGKAAFGGNGTIQNSVTFEDGSALLWRFGPTQAVSDMLKVTGNVSIGNNVAFRPITNSEEKSLPAYIEGWRVLKYDGTLNGRFASIDSSFSPFYDFELDYDEQGYVKISGARLTSPRALSDIASTAAFMAQTKMHRSAYQQIAREWTSDCPDAVRQINRGLNGQAPTTNRSAWANFIGRGDHYESTYFKDHYSFQSYGVQAGVSFLSTCTHTFGLLFGREEEKLSNSSDKVEGEDYYLGLYYGRLFSTGMDVMAYIGGGWQKNDLLRQSNGRSYGTGLNGTTFDLSFQFGSRFFTRQNVLIRPYAGLDIELVRLGAGKEGTLDGKYSNEAREYRSSNFSQVFLKVGMDASRSWKRIDFHGGANVSWSLADTCPKTEIYYPAIDDSIVGRATDLGRFIIGLNIGTNWYITERRNTMFFLDYNADIYTDRDGSYLPGTGTLGFLWRF